MKTTDDTVLPTFRYHPAPLETEAIEESDATCIVCERERGYIYTSSPYAVEEYDECICPWCIHDGSAAAKLNAEFFDGAGVGDNGSWSPVSADVIETITKRTPSFIGWQQERWWTHCNDAAVFLGRVGRAEIEGHGPAALASFRRAAGLEGDDQEQILDLLDADDSPTGYLFQCLHCGEFGGYWDSH